MRRNKETHVLIGRHAPKPKGSLIESARFPGVAEVGIHSTEQKAKTEILEFIRQSPKDAIVFIAGVSDEKRTKSTAQIYGLTLGEIIGKTEDYYVSPNKIRDWRKKGKNRISEIKKLAKKEKNRLVINYPFPLRKLSSRRAGTVLDKSIYFQELNRRTNGDQHELVKMWIGTGGRIEGFPEGPKPQDIADNYKKAIELLEQSIRGLFPDRPVCLIIVGHSWELDVAIAALANNGKVDLESFNYVTQGGIIKENESARVVFALGKTTVEYRGKTFTS